ncbi:MAG: methionine synthase [Actinomycetota bacterium]|nr:methionine synthase [Actinomycetota bacterium]
MASVNSFLEALSKRVVIFDGAMGTQIQNAALTLDDFWGKEGNSEVLNLSRPDVIRAIHAAYFEAGSDAVETNTFGANLVVQGEYEMADQVYDLNVAGARLAKEAAASFTDRPRWVAGSIGPGTKLPSLGHTTFDDLATSYGIQARGLIDGGADLLVIETCQDLLQTKSAIAGCVDAFAATGRKLPLIVQVTIESTGQMLLGSEIGAALTALEPFDVIDVIGINCATGPLEMTEHVRYLCQHSRRPVSVQPNAGLPELRDGKTFYPLTPEDLVRHQRVFVEEFGTAVAGGCCGTTPEHIRQLADALRDRELKPRDPEHEPGCSSLYVAQPFKQDVSFFVIGERCNTLGSKKFKELIAAEDFDGTVQVAKEQIREGAHSLDICIDFTGRNGVTDMTEIASRFRTRSTLPLFIDSTEPEVIETALKLVGGRCVINSINLEEGTGPETRLMRNLALAKRFGAAVIALAIEEKGQATTAGWKLEVCKRIFDLCLDYGLEAHDIIFDTLVFPISTGLEEARRAGIETLDAVERVTKEFPESFTSLGVSNVSFGLTPAGRQVLNSVFLHEAVSRGLTAAIVSPAKILPMSRIPEEQREAALDLVYDRRPGGRDPLQHYLKVFEGVGGTGGAAREDLSGLPLEERLKRRIIDGERNGLGPDLDEALSGYPALEIINTFLLAGMKVVGELFASGEMQLPFVLQSAETMKQSVAHLEPYMEKIGDGSKGRIVLATVKGDVHDIGKNLVDIILTNNGYTVYNIGIKQPIQSIIETAERESADAIGLSGLLVKSTLVMREDLEELNRRELHHYPVLLGGAALTRSYVERDLRELYRGHVFYGRDAFEGLRTMDALMTAKREGKPIELETAPKPKIERPVTVVSPNGAPARSAVSTNVQIPAAPFTGSRIVKGLAIPDIAAYVNKVALYRGQWQYRRRKDQSPEDYEAFIEDNVEPVFRSWLDRCIAEQILQPALVYGYFPAQSEGDDLIVYRDDGSEWVRFTFPRQPRDRRLCIADFFRPASSGGMDTVAFHVVTMGKRASEVAQELFAANQYTDYLYLHGLSVEMAEALAEMWHKRVREELGIAGEDAGDIGGLFSQGYRGSRYSFGYPACPNLEDQQQIFELLEPERIGVSLSEEFQLQPEQSTSAIIVHHPEAKYFSVGRPAKVPAE